MTDSTFSWGYFWYFALNGIQLKLSIVGPSPRQANPEQKMRAIYSHPVILNGVDVDSKEKLFTISAVSKLFIFSLESLAHALAHCNHIFSTSTPPIQCVADGNRMQNPQRLVICKQIKSSVSRNRSHHLYAFKCICADRIRAGFFPRYQSLVFMWDYSRASGNARPKQLETIYIFIGISTLQSKLNKNT